MTMTVSARNLLLGLTLILLAAAGCGNGSESEPPKQPAVVRKKIAMPKKQAPQAVKPQEMAAAKPQMAKVPAKAAKEAQLPVKEPKEKISEAETETKPPLQQQARAEQVLPEKKPTEDAKEAQAPVKKPKEKISEAETETKPPLQQQARAEQVLPEKKPEPQQAKTRPELLAKQAGKETAYFYDPKGKPNPFQPLFATEAPQRRMAPGKKKEKEEKRLPLTPLQRIDLSQLKLVGIIISPAGNKALVEEPSGKGYVITKGTYVGTNFGRVKNILIDRVIVEEEVEDFFSGGMKPQTTELELQKKAGQV